MLTKELILDTIKFLEYRAIKSDDGYEWREACGLSLSLRDAFQITDDEYKSIIDEMNHKLTIEHKISNPCAEIHMESYNTLIPVDGWTI